MPAPNTSLSKPHDRFFKQIFSVPRHVESFLRGELDPAWIELIDFSSLQLDANNYLSEELQETFADVVYSVDFAKVEIRFSFLFEHKSYIVQRPYIQLLDYMKGIWEQASNSETGLLRIAIPMIVYHGEGTWKYQPFWEYFEGGDHPLLRRFIPSFDYLLTNLQVDKDEEIRDRYDDLILQTSFLLMKYVRNKDLIPIVLRILQESKSLSEDEQIELYLRTFFVYLSSGSKIDKHIMAEKFNSLVEEWGMVEGSPAHQWYQEGAEKERELNAKREFQAIRNMILDGLENSRIAKLLEVSIDRVEEVARKIGKA